MTFEPDAEQAPVLEHDRGTLLVTGPPGSGKTALLRERFARLVEGGANPERVLLFVLSRRAAREAREHLIGRLARSLPELPVRTTHGYAFEVLGRRFAELGYQEPPQVLSAPEQYAVVREMLAEEPANEWPRFGRLLHVRGFAREVADFCLRAQERLLEPDALAGLAGEDAEYSELAAFYGRYLDALSAAGRIDFSGLLAQTAALLTRGVPSPDRPEHILIDDYQDVTHAAEGIAAVLVEHATSTVVAADPAGHVFSYRGGSLEPLTRATQALPVLATVELETSHRLDATALAPLEHGRPEAPPPPPEGLEARLFIHPGEEVESVAHELLRARVDEDVPWEEMAVIVRRHGHYLTTLRHALSRHGIPFVVVSESATLASEPANRPVIDLLRYVFRPETRDELIEGLLVSPVGGLDPHALRRLRREARRRDVGLRDLVESDHELDGSLRKPIAHFRKLLAGLPNHHAPDGAFAWLWREVPAFRDLVAAGATRELDALTALAEVLARFVERRPGASVEDYLDTLEAAEFGPDPWVPPEERHPRAVRIFSAHRAQGMEFEVALVVGCLEGEFPSLSHHAPTVDLERLLVPATGAERLRRRLVEERALFRLAVSRARRRTVLFASRSASAKNPRTPSRWVERLGLRWVEAPDHVEHSGSLRAMEASLRRRLADSTAPDVARLAALAALPKVGAAPGAWWGGRAWTDPGRPIYDADEPIQTSYSRLSALQNCGLQYLYAVELGLDPEASHQMWLGKVVHALIERVQRGEIERSEDTVFAELERVWEPGRFPGRAIERQRHRDARTMLRNWLAGEGVSPARTEQVFNIPIDGARLRGRIDAIFVMENGHSRVVDYKTSNFVPSQKVVEDDLQLAAYYLAMKRDEDLKELGEPRMLELAFILKSHHKEAFMQRRVLPGRRDDYEEWAETTIKELLGKIRAEDFAPDPLADCMWCDFKTICPLWPEGAEVQT